MGAMRPVGSRGTRLHHTTMRNLLLRFAALFGLLLAAAAVYFRSTWGGGLPALRGGLTVQGIGGEVRIRRDQYGIAQIASPHDSDVFFGIGYARQFVGSNAWVVSRKLTDDGRAYLANAPHLGLQIHASI